ncbi:hypothetical protein L2E82_01959 [Cichorium intybus]|uniref:Uncharacterized protein n=1 Tax=Cichorium intybus TaxID=13427 RepID=A0ACB9H1X2_CICIN|nr:hypothetical protein L2E82_01959 [Cichorium intybus]
MVVLVGKLGRIVWNINNKEPIFIMLLGFVGSLNMGHNLWHYPEDMKTMTIMDSGGRVSSGNKRRNKTQSFDQKFDKSNKALQFICKKRLTSTFFNKSHKLMSGEPTKVDLNKDTHILMLTARFINRHLALMQMQKELSIL